MKTINCALLLILLSITCLGNLFATPRLLDSKGTPTLVYSTRQLLSSYTGPALQVRRPSDNATVDVAFDSNGQLTLSSAVNPSTYGATLGDFVQGTGADAFVTTWYDQSGHANATATAVTTKSGKITIDTNGEATLSTALSTSSSYAITAVSSNTITVNQGTSSVSLLSVGQTVIGTGILPGTKITAVGARGGTSPNYTYELTLSNSHTAVISGTLAGVTGLFAGNILMQAASPYSILGVINSINSTTSLTLSEYKTTSAISWGTSHQPRLTAGGKIITLPNGQTTLRFYNGSTGSNSLIVTEFTNDRGVANNLSGISNMNLYTVFNKQGNSGNPHGLFCTQSPTGGNAGKFQATLEIAQTFNAQFSNNTTRAVSTLYTNNQTTCSRMRLSGGNMNSSLANNAATGTVATISATPLDASQIHILGYETSQRSFEGMCPELIFYGSTKAVDNDQYATAILADQNNTFTFAAPTATSASANSSFGFTANWTAPTNSTGELGTDYTYSLQYSKSADFTANAVTVANIADITKELSGLDANTTYYYRVLVNRGEASQWSNTINTATTANTIITALNLENKNAITTYYKENQLIITGDCKDITVVSIYDLSGKMLLSANVKNTNTNIIAASLKTGLYMITLKSGTSTTCSKLIVSE